MKQELLLTNDKKVIFLILDGVGDIPNPQFSHRTPLEAAKKPNIDALAAERGILGRIVPVDIGITPGSGPGHLSLFGYDPLEYEIGRGVLEVLGLNMDLQDGDLAARANFCTIQEGIVVDRRAGRIPTEETVRICEKISSALPEIDGVKILIKPGKSHRFALIFRGKNLSDRITDADPHKDHLPVMYSQPKDTDAQFSSQLVNTFMEKTIELLKDEKVANGILMRGFSTKPIIPPFSVTYGMKALAIATYPMYRGIAKVLGMDVKDEPRDYQEMLKTLAENYDSYHFFFLHIKETDLAGEDGNFAQKVTAVENVDPIIPSILRLDPQVFVVTGDHSTPCSMKGHSWHPVPLLLVTKTGETDGAAFHERNCITGSIGTIYSKQLMPLVLAHCLRLDKYGA